jgi:hypothetical protein
VEREYNRIAGFRADNRLEQCSRSRVSDRSHPRDNADRLGYLDVAFHFVAFDNADSLEVLDAVPDILCCEDVLNDFVFDNAATGLFNREFR